MKFKLRYFLEDDFHAYHTIVSNQTIARLSGLKILNNKFECWMAFKGMIGRQGFLAIVDESEQVIGGIFIFEQEISNHYELGYLLEEKYWNRGIMSKAVYFAIKNLVSRKQGDLKITANVLFDNLASGRVLEKNGFVGQVKTVESVSGYDGKLRQEIKYELNLKRLSITNENVRKYLKH